VRVRVYVKHLQHHLILVDMQIMPDSINDRLNAFSAVLTLRKIRQDFFDLQTVTI
jgi:hypothetical protein